ncbi:LysR family transcriptional regulator [Variovorax sp. GT1P44]|uniref:LysR family transcriptional regulator n=1 Tax=Variovorax sp. GT1P44 TaxID=3443742 RepID=UPI003F472EF5
MSSLFDSMDLNLLRVYEALMSEGNVTRAAVKLNRTQSAISNSLARLRETLGDPLFETTATGIRPTTRGSELWRRLEPHCRGIEEAFSSAGFDPSRYRGRFLISMSDYELFWMMPRLERKLQTMAPGVRIDVMPYAVVGLDALFERGGVDLAIGLDPDGLADGLSGFRTHPLWPVGVRCVIGLKNPLASGKLTLERYLQARHVEVLGYGLTPSSYGYDALLAAHGVHRKIALTISTFMPIAAIVAESGLVATVPTPIADFGVHASRVCERDPPIPLPARKMNLIWHRRSEADSAHRWLRNLIVEAFAGENATA